MNILLTGASGFIGRHIDSALAAAGHHVIYAASKRYSERMTHDQKSRCMIVDFARDTHSDVWLERLQLNRYSNIEVIINAVGVLRDSARGSIEAIHRDTPIALFDAYANIEVSSGVKRVIQLSALGIQDNPTRYASTKRAADQHLLKLAHAGHFRANVLRPSVVFGRGGASSRLFMNLARLPLVCLPEPVLRAKIQPVVVTDLADAIVTLVSAHDTYPDILPLTGPQSVRLGNFIASLRHQLGHHPAKVFRLPDVLTEWSARLGDKIPVSPWCSESLALLAKDNVGDPEVLPSLIGRETIHYRHLVQEGWY